MLYKQMSTALGWTEDLERVFSRLLKLNEV